MVKQRVPIYFVTTNTSKFASFQLFFENMNVELIQQEVELYEPQSLNTQQIIAAKLSQAKEKFPDKKILVDDRSLFIPALRNFPGPFLKLAIESLGADGFLKLMSDQEDRTMIFSTAIGFFDGQKDYFFRQDEKGHMLLSKRGKNLRGWSEILYIYASEHHPGKSLAEYSDEEWRMHHKQINEIPDLLRNLRDLVTP